MTEKRHAWLSRRRRGGYMVTGLKPILAPCKSEPRIKDLYIVPGDPLAHFTDMCEEAALWFFGVKLEPLQMTRVETMCHPVGEIMTPTVGETSGQVA